MSENGNSVTEAVSLGALAAALAKAQRAFPVIPRDRTVTVKGTTRAGVPFEYTFAYAPLDTIFTAVRVPLADNGLALAQLLDGDGLVTLLLHESGGKLESRLPVPKAEDIQKQGSAITYLRRYAIQALLGIAAEEDDDGNAHAGNQRSTGRRQPIPKGATRDEQRSIAADAPKASGVLRDRDTGEEVTLLDPPSPTEPTEREKVLAHIKEMGDALGLKPEGRQALWKTHVGNYGSGTAPVEKLRALEASMVAQCERAK